MYEIRVYPSVPQDVLQSGPRGKRVLLGIVPTGGADLPR